jgi:isoquinoline 1-oxidoreductase subunit beta
MFFPVRSQREGAFLKRSSPSPLSFSKTSIFRANIMMLAEELELNWSSVRWEQAPTIPRIYQNLSAAGSSGTIHRWLKLRRAGAQAREMLLAAAAQRWGVDVKECHAENGAIVRTAGGRRIVYRLLRIRLGASW